MDTIDKFEEIGKDDILCMSLSQDQRKIAIGTNSGFQIFRLYPTLKLRHLCYMKGGIGICEMFPGTE